MLHKSKKPDSSKSETEYLDGSNISKKDFMEILVIHLILGNLFLVLNLIIATFLLKEFDMHDKRHRHSSIVFVVVSVPSIVCAAGVVLVTIGAVAAAVGVVMVVSVGI